MAKRFCIQVVKVMSLMCLAMLLGHVQIVHGQETTTSAFERRDAVTSKPMDETTRGEQATTIAPPPDPPGSFEDPVTTQDSQIDPVETTQTQTTDNKTTVETTTVSPIKPVKPAPKTSNGTTYSGKANQPLAVFSKSGGIVTFDKTQADYTKYIQRALAKAGIQKQGDLVIFTTQAMAQGSLDFYRQQGLPFPMRVCVWVWQVNLSVYEFFN